MSGADPGIPHSALRTPHLLAVLALAAALRLIGLTSCPPPILPDEATAVYDAWSLIETGNDRWGHSWPLFLESFGRADYRGALYCYVALPFVALLGPEHFTWAARLPAALAGILTVGALYALVARISGRSVAFWAALLLAVSPWHVQVSRYGHESSLTPLWTVLWGVTLWTAVRARDTDLAPRRLRAGWFVLTAALLAISVYSYPSMKLFMPAMTLAALVIFRRDLREMLGPSSDAGANRRALLAATIVFAALIGPMVWATATAGERINARAVDQSLFHQGWPTSVALAQAARQYLAHFGPDWLFVEGSRSVLSTIPRSGQLHWLMLPLLLVGLATVLARLRANRAYKLLLAWFLLHPLASGLTLEGPNAMRAACGLGSFEWVAAIGAVRLAGFASAIPVKPLLAGALGLVLVAVSAAWPLYWYAVYFGRHPLIQHLMQTDLQEAVRFLRPRWRDYDRIFVSDHVSGEREWQSDHPYIYVLLFLPVEPSEFQAWDKEIHYARPSAPFHVVKSIGPFTLSTAPAALDAYFRDPAPRRALIVARPGDITGGTRLHEVRDRRGEVRFEIIEVIKETPTE